MSDREASGTGSLASRLLVIGGVVAMALVVLMMALVDRSIRSVWLDDLDSELESLGGVVGAGLEVVTDRQGWIEGVATRSGVRVTLIALDGSVVADTHQDPEIMDNHASRGEVVAALMGEVGTATRLSASTGFEQRYVALPPADGVVVRVSKPLSDIEQELGRTRQAVAAAGVTVAALAILLLVLLGRRLARPVVALADQAQAIASGDLTVVPERSVIAELDRLGSALGDIVSDLGGRMSEAEEASETLKVVLAAIPQGTVLFDEAGEVIYANPVAGDILGSVPPRLGAISPLQLQDAVREARSSGVQKVREVDHGLPVRRIRAVATPLGADGRVLLVIVDITERVRVESMRRDFVANASHELKTPVATIAAAAEALQIALSRNDPDVERFAHRIDSAARQLDRLVGDLLDLSRLEQETPELRPVQLDEIARSEVERSRGRLEDNGLVVEVSTEAVTVMGDERGLATAVRNLIDNAVRHTPAGGRITVAVGAEGNTAMLRVSDTGEGIPTTDLDRVFERFYRVDTARSRDTGGTGLGLAIVRHVAETHGGRASVSSELGRGSTFTVTLPLA